MEGKDLIGSILYVDDEVENLVGLKYAFSDKYDIITCQEPSEALEIIKTVNIKVLIADQMMPEMTGIDLLESTKKISPDTIGIILSAYNDTKVFLKAINQVDVFHFLTKPWAKKEVDQAIKSALDVYYLKIENRQLIEKLTIQNEILKQSEKNFKNIVNTVSDTIVISDFDGNVIDANDTFFKNTGVDRNRISNIKSIDYITQKKPEFKKRAEMLKRKIVPPPIDSTVVLKNNQKMNVEISNNSIRYNGNDAIVTIVKNKTLQKETERKILNAIIDTEERERKRIAEDIHDGIGPMLSTLSLYFNSITSDKYSEEEKKNMVENINNILKETISISKNLSNRLMPNVLNDFGLEAAIRLYVHQVQETNVLNIKLDMSNYKPIMSKNIEIIIYRSLLEFINNTLKYAEASEIEILYSQSNEKINVIYQDNGKGFDFEDVIRREGMHLGIKNILYRINSLNGSIQFERLQKRGIKYQIIIPTQ